MENRSPQSLFESVSARRVPVHVAIIMDGNGRWAKARGLDRTDGHVAGVDAVRRVVEAAANVGVKHLTLYAFSTENWNRPAHEVEALMHLMSFALAKETPDLIRNGVRLDMIGDFSRIPADAMASLRNSIEATSAGGKMTLHLAISYSSRWELTAAAAEIARKAAAGEIAPDDITDTTVSAHLATAGIPDPDLLIRTGGDFRISNFLLWQIAYSELYFTPDLWPDFDAERFYKAIIDYQSRERRFGLTSEQIQSTNQ